MRKELRPYQAKAMQEAFEALKKNADPVLLVASVGAGKSLIISEAVLKLEKLGKRILCLVNNAELVRNNAQTYAHQGGTPGIFCQTLKLKQHTQPVIFATPQSVMAAIKKNHPIGNIRFNMIVVDECHGIDHLNHKTTFMRILRHYKQEYPDMRLLGLTGTPFRYKGYSIVGDDCLFKSQVGNITTQWLIENNYLVTPIIGHHATESLDFSHVRIKPNGLFDAKAIEDVIAKSARLTAQILTEVVALTESRNGAFIFAATVKHCQECLEALPEGLAAVITGSTPQDERHAMLTAARSGEIKYLISVNCLMVGVDVPYFDTVVWLRPTESLVLFVQGIGRGLRLHDSKQDALVLDYAGNIDRFEDFDDPIILEALKPKGDDDALYEIPCIDCKTLNKVTARRCIGHNGVSRCEHYFEFKDCPACNTQNDLVARYCRGCDHELIDPNAKLSTSASTGERFEFEVKTAKYWVLEQHTTQTPMMNARYETTEGIQIYECYTTVSDKAKNYFYGKFMKAHVANASAWYPHLQSLTHMRVMIQKEKISTPNKLLCVKKGEKYHILKKEFLV